MNLSPLEQINNLQTNANSAKSPDALRRAAQQFEAVLLMQLTSALNSTNNDADEDQLFGGDGGTGMAKQMFSEQLATTMSESGGVGLSDLIMQKFGAANAKSTTGKIKSLSGAISAVKDIRENIPTQKIERKNNLPLVNKSAKFILPSEPLFTGNADEAEVISTFEDQLRTEGVDESDRNLMLDGKVQNSTRARIVPNSPVTQAETVAPATIISDSFNTSEKITFQIPVDGSRISSGFGNRFHPIDKKIKFHAGVDLAVPVGTKVDSTADGVVKFAGWNGGYGNLIIIQHPDGRESRYGHLSKILVSEGEKVSGGQQIALSGSTGKSTGPHLHFEIRENGEVVNPLKILSNVLPKAAEK
jgi:murein DD-endopeptidase MepM/ murein hydrolase activator NlpD